MPLILMENIIRNFVNGQVTTEVLKGVSLNVEKGEYLSIMGPSGSGKSTLLNLIGLLDLPTSGDYLLDGTPVNSLNDDDLAATRNRVLGFVFQTFHLLKNLNALQNVALPMIYRGMEKTEREILAREALALVGLSERETHFPSQLSGGEQQRVAIARAIVGKPQVLLADEPTGALDSKNSVNIMEIFTRLNKEQGLTIIQVTHDLGVAYYGQRIIFLADGEISKIETVSNEQRQMGEQSLDDGRINSEQAAGGISNG